MSCQLILVGDNTLISDTRIGLNCRNLTIDGSGTLSISAPADYGLHATGSMCIKDGKITAESAEGTLLLSTLFQMEGGYLSSTATAEGSCGLEFAASVLSGGTLIGRGDSMGVSTLRSGPEVQIGPGVHVYAYANSGSGMNSYDINVNGGSLTASSVEGAAVATHITFTSGSLIAEGNQALSKAPTISADPYAWRTDKDGEYTDSATTAYAYSDTQTYVDFTTDDIPTTEPSLSPESVDYDKATATAGASTTLSLTEVALGERPLL